MKPSKNPSGTAKPTAAGGTKGQWRIYGSLPEQLWGNGAVQLPNGKVLIFSASSGGDSHAATDDAWLLDPRTGKLIGGPPMVASQSVPAVALMPGGSVMIAGGWRGGSPVSDAQLYDGTSGAFKPIKPMSTPRYQAVATDIGSGRVLVAGGWVSHGANSYTATASAEIYDPATGVWTPTASMSVPRALATATRLQDGRVLVAGGDESWTGSNSRDSNQQVLSSAEIYSPTTKKWTSAGDMSSPRAAHSAMLQLDGKVVVVGGWIDGHQLGTASADLYTPGKGWQSAAAMPGAHAQGRLIRLTDGRLLAVGGVGPDGRATAEVDVYDPKTGAWKQTGGLLKSLYWPAVTSLSDGRVLLVGGSTDGALSGQLEIFTPPAR